MREVSAPIPRLPGQLVARVHVKVESSVGAVTIESVPAGADIVLDDKPAGHTPITIGDVRLDQRHRVDLILAGHEIDQFVVLPEKDGSVHAPPLEGRAEGEGVAGALALTGTP